MWKVRTFWLVLSSGDTASPVIGGLGQSEQSGDRDRDGDPLVELLRAWQQGDPDAFDALMLRMHGKVFRVAYRLLGNRSEAEEAAQDVFWRLYRAGRKIREPEALHGWVYRTTVNAARSRGRRLEAQSETASMELAAWSADGEVGTEDRLVLREAVQQALGCLSPKEREVVVLRDIEGLEIADVASAMRVFAVTVRTHLSRARLKLRRELEQRGIHP